MNRANFCVTADLEAVELNKSHKICRFPFLEEPVVQGVYTCYSDTSGGFGDLLLVTLDIPETMNLANFCVTGDPEPLEFNKKHKIERFSVLKQPAVQE